ncbi:hypothetical protein ACSSZE_03585 [Acidithiobacillus caldus]
MIYVGSNQQEITHPGDRCDDDHSSAYTQGENLMENEDEAMTVDAVKDQSHTGQAVLTDVTCAFPALLYDEEDDFDKWLAMQVKEMKERQEQEKRRFEKELEEVHCALEFCRSAESMVSYTLANHKNLITHPKKSFTLEDRVYGKHSKRYEERARLSEDWHENLPYALMGVKSDGYMRWRIVNRDYKALADEKSGSLVSGKDGNTGIRLDPDGRHFANVDPSGFWLYHQDPPWNAPKHARAYLVRLRYVIRILKEREEDLIVVIRDYDLPEEPDAWPADPDDWDDDQDVWTGDWIKGEDG